MSSMVPAEEVKMLRCRLLELPEELQLEIYELVVIYEKPIRIVHLLCEGYQRSCKPEEEDTKACLARFFSERKQPALSKTCRSIRDIVLPIYYKRNSFHVCCCYDDHFHREEGRLRRDYVSSSRKWLLSMGESNRALLRDFEIHQGDHGRGFTHSEVVLTQGMQGLKLHAYTWDSTPPATARVMIEIWRQQITFVG
ncbi:hypothetical protein LTS10_000192 [Elasticomyces elasticus]|nr:hypothetical protein LTS10_000192 [Elasticomyces elasticus]